MKRVVLLTGSRFKVDGKVHVFGDVFDIKDETFEQYSTGPRPYLELYSGKDYEVLAHRRGSLGSHKWEQGERFLIPQQALDRRDPDKLHLEVVGQTLHFGPRLNKLWFLAYLQAKGLYFVIKGHLKRHSRAYLWVLGTLVASLVSGVVGFLAST